MSVASLKSQDVLLLCKLIVVGSNRRLRQIDLSNELGISQSEVSNGLEKLEKSRLIDPVTKLPNKMAAFEFLESGVKFFFPAEQSEYTVGIPTSIYHKPLSEVIIEKGVPLVWPSNEGTKKGIAIKPIHDSAPFAASKDKNLYELLAVLDALRSFHSGRIKEQAIFFMRKFVFGSKDESN